MKTPISEQAASVTVLDQIFKHIDYEWPVVWEELESRLAEFSSQKLNPEFSKFSLILATTALNLRAAFDIFPKAQAERIFVHTMKLYEAQFQNPKQFQAISSTIRKYLDVYNMGLTGLSNPVEQVASLLYQNLAIRTPGGNTKADTGILSYLSQMLLQLSGKWDHIREKFEIVETVQ